MSHKMRETMLVRGKLSSRSPHYEGSERDDSESSEKGVGPFLMMKVETKAWGMSLWIENDVIEITPAAVRTYPRIFAIII